MGTGRRGRLRSRGVKHGALCLLGPRVDEPHAFPAAWLLWEDVNMHLALRIVHHTDLQTWEPRLLSGRRRKVSGLACTPHHVVAFPGNSTHRPLSEQLVSSQIRRKGVVTKDQPQLLE